MSTFYGCDVSTYQGSVDWRALNPGAAFVFIKAGGGDDGIYIDSKFSANRAGARALGNEMPRGYYWFAGNNSAIQEAQAFVKTVSPLQVGEVLVLDAEAHNGTNPVWCLQFLQHVEKLVGFKPLIYMNSNLCITANWQAVARNGNGLWIADYGVTPKENVPIKWWSFYAFHQYGDNGKFPGIKGSADANAFFAPVLTDFFKYGKQAAAVKPQPVTPAPVIPSPGTVITPTQPPVIPPVQQQTNQGINMGKYNKTLIAIAGLVVTFLLQHYGSDPVIKDVVMALTAAGIYQIPNN